jgi:signal transduction histidine kinase
MGNGIMAHFRSMVARAQAWPQSLNAKLFVATALLTSILTIAVAVFVISAFKRSIESYTRGIALRTVRGVVEDINRLDPEFKFRRETAELLLTWTNPESVRQIDLFTAAKIDGEDYVEVWATSENRPQAVAKDDAEVLKMMELDEEQVELIALASGQMVWRVYMPVHGSRAGRGVKVLLRAYCTLDRWNAVWNQTFAFTIKILPIALLVEFAFLWVLTFAFVQRPMRKIMKVMKRFGEGDVSARAGLQGRDELGQIARHFDAMAGELQRTSQEREALLSEISGFNATLQERIDEALSELQAKNSELELLMESISLLREELSQQERLAVAGQITAAFAHEVGTPLNLVNSHLQLLISDPGTDGKIRERLGTIQTQIDRVGDIVRKLLGLTRRVEPRLETVALPQLIEELQRLWAPALSAHKVQFTANVPDNCLLKADRKQLEQIFINLVNNSVDAMPQGGSIHLEAAQARPSEWAFALRDTGAGIPQEILSKVFKPMFTTKTEGKGTGLGLAICREIGRAHGGDSSIESAEGQGATVRFTMPGA